MSFISQRTESPCLQENHSVSDSETSLFHLPGSTLLLFVWQDECYLIESGCMVPKKHEFCKQKIILVALIDFGPDISLLPT